MQEIYRFIDDAIEADRQRYTDIADQIWDHPETRFEEFWSAEHLASALESASFTVTRNVGNIPNAFIASFGQGKPVIALLGEYDAYSAAIFLIPICISFDTAEKRRYATYLILNRRFSFEF